jgi:hypothetical protein
MQGFLIVLDVGRGRAFGASFIEAIFLQTSGGFLGVPASGAKILFFGSFYYILGINTNFI